MFATSCGIFWLVLPSLALFLVLPLLLRSGLSSLFSGLLYQWGGLMCSLTGSAVMLITCWIITLMLPARVDALPRPLSSDVRPIGEAQ